MDPTNLTFANANNSNTRGYMIASRRTARSFLCLYCLKHKAETVVILSNFDVRALIKKAFAVCLAQSLRISF